MSKKLTDRKCHYTFLKVLSRLSPSEKVEVIKRLDQKGIDALSRFLFNFLKVDYGLAKSKRLKLRKQLKGCEKDLNYICAAKNSWKLRQVRCCSLIHDNY